MLLRLLILAASLGLLALGLVYPWSKTPIIVGLCYALAALGVSVMVRAGQVSFGHALYACVAGYGLAFVARAWPQVDGLLLLLAGTLAGTLAGALVGLFVVRYRGIFFGMLNLAISMVLYSMLGKFYTLTGGTDGLRINRPTLLGITFERSGFETSLLVLTLLLCLLVGWAVQRLFASGTGQALAAIKSNETRLEYLGLSARRVLWNGYVVSAMLVGMSGALFAMVQGLVTPDLGSWLRSGEFVFITILGGANHAIGAFLGAAVFEAVKLFAAAYMTGVWQLLLGATLIVVILVAPTGIVGMLGPRATAPPDRHKE
jgi:ABC-type branched-subunit amino acid transport system permease subunit